MMDSISFNSIVSFIWELLMTACGMFMFVANIGM